jgi:23S rRNA (cytidine1920-2'-O)/16S rRNA (cytidine1409-2'-O)-methyltransferase
VVRDAALHRSICAMIADWWAALPGWQVLGIAESPITGPEGNKEFLIAARREA